MYDHPKVMVHYTKPGMNGRPMDLEIEFHLTGVFYSRQELEVRIRDELELALQDAPGPFLYSFLDDHKHG